jgi:TnpA family transposase
MKRNWEIEELIEYWTLLPSEMVLLGNKTGQTRIGFAVSLKYFQLESKFPNSKPDLPAVVLSHIASQVNVPVQEYHEYDWHSRSSRYHRNQIREYFGFRSCRASDLKTVFNWLVRQVLPHERDVENLRLIVEGRLIQLKIEPPQRSRIERLIRSALHQSESHFFETIYQKITRQSRVELDTLLETSDLENEANSQFSLFYYLNSEPGRATLDSFLSEITKLEHLRKIGLSNDLFANISPKILQTYARRAATEPPRELRAHPAKIRYTLVAAFCWQRMREVTDNLVDLLIQIVHGISRRATKKVDAQLIQDFKRVSGKHNLLYQMANASLEQPEGKVSEVIYPVASDSKKFGSWNQNLMTEWHVRYGGRGVMIYWHVEKKSTCIYSQLKTCSSSEVAAMIEGVLRHDTEMTVKKNFVDTHGQSEVAFAFTHLLGFELMPRLKGIPKQKLYRPEVGDKSAYPHLQLILTRPINWDLIRQQYDQMIKYATALRLGTADPEAILRRFTKANVKHPTYQALGELGKVLKTIFLCQYLAQEELRREINEGLNVVENWNSANSFIFYGKSSEMATNQPGEQILSVLSLHLLQVCLVYINTLMLQQVLLDPLWEKRLTKNDRRALTPLIYGHVNPYGTFRLDMNQRLKIEPLAREAVG